jgi:thiol-disulfide isomerase/thioredoxin
MALRTKLLPTLGLCLTLLTGCASGGQAPTVQVANETGVEVTRANPNYNPVPLQSADEVKQLQLYDANGQVVHPNPGTPMLIVAYWCPHCQRTLVLLNANKNKLKQLPVVISAGFQPNTTLQQAKDITRQEFKLLGLSGFQVYYCLTDFSRDLLPMYPTLVYSSDQKLVRLSGEHTLDVWSKALGKKE